MNRFGPLHAPSRMDICIWCAGVNVSSEMVLRCRSRLPPPNPPPPPPASASSSSSAVSEGLFSGRFRWVPALLKAVLPPSWSFVGPLQGGGRRRPPPVRRRPPRRRRRGGRRGRRKGGGEGEGILTPLLTLSPGLRRNPCNTLQREGGAKTPVSFGPSMGSLLEFLGVQA